MNPVKYTREQGGPWMVWTKGMDGGSAHSILFEDGTIFDLYNGWRNTIKCPNCTQPIPGPECEWVDE